MARQVYYDPFGMRMQGYRMGVQDETGLQSSTRQARLSDWQFNNELPLQLQAAQREEQFNQYADPFRRRGLDYTEQATQGGLYDQEFNRAGQFGLATGIDAPLNNLMFNRFTPDRTYTELDPATGLPIADPTYFYNQRGGMSQYGVRPGSSLDFLDRDFSLRLAEMQAQDMYRRQQAEQAAAAAQQSAQWEQLQRQQLYYKMLGITPGAVGGDPTLDW